MKKTLIVVAHPNIEKSVVNQCWINELKNTLSSLLFMSFIKHTQTVGSISRLSKGSLSIMSRWFCNFRFTGSTALPC